MKKIMATIKKKDQETEATKKKSSTAATKKAPAKVTGSEDKPKATTKVASEAKPIAGKKAKATEATVKVAVVKSVPKVQVTKKASTVVLLPHQQEEVLLPHQPTLKLVQIKSPIGREAYQRKTLIGLGLNKIGRESIVHDTPSIRGMINAVRHLIKMDVIDTGYNHEIEHNKR